MFDKIILATGHGGRRRRNGSWRSWLRCLISGSLLLSLVAAASLITGGCGKETPPPVFPPATVLAAKVVSAERGRGRTRVVIDLGADDHVVVGMRGRLVTVDGRPESARFAVTDVAARHAWAEAPGDVAIGTGRVLLWNPSVHAMPEEP